MEAEIPNEAITSGDGFPGQGMPNLWLLSADEGVTVIMDTGPDPDDPDLIGKVINFLCGFAHNRNVYAAVVVPSEDDQPELAWALGPIWDIESLPVIEVNPNGIQATAQFWEVEEGLSLAIVIGHELGHTVLWEVDHNPQRFDDPYDRQSFGGNAGHHVIGQDGRVGQHTIHCLMWPYFPAVICPRGYADHRFCPFRAQCNSVAPTGWTVFTPTEFCDANPGCQNLWKLKP